VLSGNYAEYEAANNRGYVASIVTREVGARNPLFGMGPGSFGTSYGSETGAVGVKALGLDVVSSRFVGDVGWVSVFAQTGLAGFVGLAGLVVVCVRVFLDRARRVEDRGFAYTVACVIGVGMLASTPLVAKSVSSMLWLVLGLVAFAKVEVTSDRSS
jgi:O-antigen ligase